MSQQIRDDIARVHRQEYGQLLAGLVARFGDFELAEEAIQDAFVAALDAWRANGRPDRPGAWLTTVARRKAIDRLRRRRTTAVDPGDLADHPPAPLVDVPDFDDIDAIPDERLKLIFTCCHPALPPEQRVALTLHTLGGLKTPEIAAAFRVPVPTLAQRLVRAKRKIKAAGIPYYVPPARLLAARLDAVLAVLYLIFTEGYAASSGDSLIRRDLCDEAIRLARILEALIRRQPTDVPEPQYAEVLGLLALMLLHHSRRRARVGDAGELILLADQERREWDWRAIEQGLALVDKALAIGAPGPYQIQAAISALHARALSYEETDWREISALYAVLRRHLDTPIVRLNEAVAISLALGPAQAMFLLAPLAGELHDYAPYHLARADVLARLGEHRNARLALQRALELTDNDVEKAFIRRRLGELGEW